MKYVNRKINKYIKIDVNFIQDADIFTKISGTACKIYLLLKSYYNLNVGYVFPHVSTLAKRAGVSPETVRRAIKELEKFDLISVQRNCKGNSNRYYFPEENKSPHKYDSTLKYDRTVPTEMTVESPQICGDHVTKNLNKFINLTTTNKQVQNSDVVDVETNNCKNTISNETPVKQSDENYKNNYINDLVIKYKDYQAKIKVFPHHKELFIKSYLDALKSHHHPDFVELAAEYTKWSNAHTVAVRRPNKFIKWILDNPYEADFTEYFKHLNKIYRLEQEKLLLEQQHKQKLKEQEEEEKEKPSAEETAEFFRQLKNVINKKT